MKDIITLIEKKYGEKYAPFVLGYLSYLQDRDLEYEFFNNSDKLHEFNLKNLPEKILPVINNTYNESIKCVIIDNYLLCFSNDVNTALLDTVEKYINNANPHINFILKDMFDLYTAYTDIFFYDKIHLNQKKDIYSKNEFYSFESETYNYLENNYSMLIFKLCKNE
jgi:hypothetical protein